MKKLASLALSLFLISGPAFADSTKDADPKPAKPAAAKKADKSDAAIAAQLEELRQALESQQEQLQLLKEEIAKRDRQIDEAREEAAAANARAAEATNKATEAVSTTAEAKSTASTLTSSVADLKASNDALRATVNTAQAEAKKATEEGPATIKYKGVSITPGGFIAAESVYRNRTASADVNTPFTGIPFPGNSLSKVSEFNASGRQSRLSLLAESKVGSAKLTGYYEADFLSAGTTSNNRQSNSYTFRQRQIYGQVTFDNGFALTGGQMWSLATENRKGVQNRTEATPLVVDAQYNVGFTWARQYGLRVAKDFGGKFSLAASIEGPQTTVGGRGFSTYTNTSATGTATVFQNFFSFAPGAGGGLYNAFDATGYSPNKAPDFIVKATADPGFGHYEVFGILSTFRNRVYPCAVVGTLAGATTPTLPCAIDGSTSPSALGAFNDTRNGGGVGGSARVPLFAKKLEVGAKLVAGDGIGRYGSAQLADMTFRPDGTQALIRTMHGLGSIEFHANPKLDVYAYYGVEYAGRAAYTGYNIVTITNTPAIPGVPASGGNPAQPPYPATTTTKISTSGIGGYGSPFANNFACSAEKASGGTSAPGAGSCAGDIRAISEATLGFWHKIYQGPKGGVRWGIQYSYLTKTGWSGIGGVPAGGAAIAPKAVDNMVFTSFRYYLP